MSFLRLKIVSPEKKVFEEGDFESVTLPTINGEITVLPGHIPILGKLSSGEIVARKKGTEELLVTLEGFYKVDETGEISIMSDYAVRSEDVEVARVEEAKKKAEDTMKEKVSEKEFAIAEAELRRTLLELKVAKRRRTRVGSE